MNKICGIYKITNPKNKIYIGQSVNIYLRWHRYKNLKCSSQLLLYNSLKKYGVNNHKFEIIHICNPFELNNLEKYYIKIFQSFNSENGLNLKAGGNGGGKCSNITKKKLSISHLGQTAHNKGKKMSQDQFEKCKKTMFKSGSLGIRKGVKLTTEHKLKLSIAHKGKKLTEEHKKKISDKMKISMIGNKNRCKGYNNLPEPSKEKIIELINELSKFTSVYQKDNLKRLIK